MLAASAQDVLQYTLHSLFSFRARVISQFLFTGHVAKIRMTLFLLPCLDFKQCLLMESSGKFYVDFIYYTVQTLSPTVLCYLQVNIILCLKHNFFFHL